MLIGQRLFYNKGWHDSLKGQEVQIVSVHRGEKIFDEDVLIGELQDGDWLEFAPIIVDDGKERPSFTTYDALPSHLIWQD